MSKIKRKTLYRFISHMVPKKDYVLVWEPWSIETNSVATANYIKDHTDKKIYFVVPKKYRKQAKALLTSGIQILDKESKKRKSIFLRCKYIFTAHHDYPNYYTKNQVVINLWHGIPYKKICRMRGKSGVFANITVATSELTKIAFKEAFGVESETIKITGYPRNDIMLQCRKKKSLWKEKILSNLDAYDKIIIWLPTRRKDKLAGHSIDGVPIDNPFQINEFDSDKFNRVLKEKNTLCFVKPHPMDYTKVDTAKHSNIKVIDDKWLWNKGITIYHLAACTDTLISDVSSIIIDYLLLDLPVICFSTDFEEYKESRGFYFEDIENWLPSKLIQNQDEFFELLEDILNEKDKYKQKRKKLTKHFFKYQDDKSTERLIRHVFK